MAFAPVSMATCSANLNVSLRAIFVACVLVLGLVPSAFTEQRITNSTQMTTSAHPQKAVRCSKYQHEVQRTFKAPVTARLTAPLYLVIMVPPFMGSSALENLLASSPYVTTMCNHTGWQCESTWNLCKAGILDCKKRWEPNSTNWTRAYNYFHRVKIWDDMSKMIRIDKSPPNVAKYLSLAAYFQKINASYMFVGMIPDRCRVSRHHYTLEEVDKRLELMHNMEKDTDPKHLVMLNYTEMRTRTHVFVKRLLTAIPALGVLRTDTVSIHAGASASNSNEREESLHEYIKSSKCAIKNYC